MTQTVSSTNPDHRHVPFTIIKEAASGDAEAMARIVRHYESYIRRIATVTTQYGTRHVDADLYERLKARLMLETVKFCFRPADG